MSEFETKKIELEEHREFEQGLARALRPVDAPKGFAARVMAQAEAESRPANVVTMMPKRHAWLRGSPAGLRNGWMSGAVAASLLVGIFVAQDVHQHRERETADRQFALSMQIQDRAMEHTRQQLQRAGVPLD